MKPGTVITYTKGINHLLDKTFVTISPDTDTIRIWHTDGLVEVLGSNGQWSHSIYSEADQYSALADIDGQELVGIIE